MPVPVEMKDEPSSSAAFPISIIDSTDGEMESKSCCDDGGGDFFFRLLSSFSFACFFFFFCRRRNSLLDILLLNWDISLHNSGDEDEREMIVTFVSITKQSNKGK